MSSFQRESHKVCVCVFFVGYSYKEQNPTWMEILLLKEQNESGRI